MPCMSYVIVASEVSVDLRTLIWSILNIFMFWHVTCEIVVIVANIELFHQ